MPENNRLTVDLDNHTYKRYVTLIPWGLRGKIIQLLLLDLLDIIEKNGTIVLSAIINRVLNIEHILQGLPNNRKENEE